MLIGNVQMSRVGVPVQLSVLSVQLVSDSVTVISAR